MSKYFIDTNVLIYANVALHKLGQRREVVLRQLHLLEKLEIQKTYGITFGDVHRESFFLINGW